MSLSRQILLNTASRWIAQGVSAAIGIVLVPVLIRKLGVEGYGFASLLGVIVSVSLALDMGIRTALTRQLSEEISRGDGPGFQRILGTGLLCYLGLGAALSTACWLAAPALATLFKVSPALRPEGIVLIRWFSSASLMLAFVGAVSGSLLAACNRYDLSNLVGTSTDIVKGALILTLMFTPVAGLRSWALATVACDALAVALSWCLAWRVAPGRVVLRLSLNRSAMRTLFRTGGPLFAVRATHLVSTRLDPVILSAFLGPAGVALYRPAARLSSLVQPIVNALSEQLMPLATGLHVSGDQERLRRVLLSGTKFTLLLGIAPAVFLGVYAVPLMALWLKPSLGVGYMESAAVLWCWAVVDLFGYAGGTQWPILLAMHRLKFLLAVTVPLAVVNLGLSIWLVGFTKLGVVGVMVATVAIAILRRPVMAVYTAHAVGLSGAVYWRLSYARATLVLIAVAAVAWGFQHLHPVAGFRDLAAAAALTAAVWAPLTWWLGLVADERAMLLRAARGLLPAQRAPAKPLIRTG